MQAQRRSKRKPSGGRYHKPHRDKRKFELARFAANTILSDQKIKKVRTGGNNSKTRLMATSHTNLAIKDKVQKVKIKNVVDNPANKFLARRNIITKGTIIVTEQGNARVTSRPGQDGTVNAILIKEKK